MKKNKLPVWAGLLIAGCMLFQPTPAYAYLDPGTGSMLLSVLVGVFSSAYFVLRRLPSLVRAGLFRLNGKKHGHKRHSLVFYAESAAYWSTFRPVLEALGARGAPALYLTSDEKDPCFSAEMPACISCRFIGTGNRAYTALGFLEADVCVMTTPGLDVLQIRRSRGVHTYVHLVHAVTDIHFYKLFSFDYYDAVLCSGPDQIRSLRALESARGTAAKELAAVGCAYMDGLAARCLSEGCETADPNCVLVAPTWGGNGLLSRTGATVPRCLAEAGFTVLLRPHPQSFISEKRLMDRLREELNAYPSIIWDTNPDGFASLSRAAVLVSDLSGVVFDFAFVFLRPVVTLEYKLEARGVEAMDLPYPAWEVDVLDKVGQRLSTDDLASLPDVVRSLRDARGMRRRLQDIREAHVVNFGRAADVIADRLVTFLSRTGGGE